MLTCYHKHRGVEVRFQDLAPADGVLLAEPRRGGGLGRARYGLFPGR